MIKHMYCRNYRKLLDGVFAGKIIKNENNKTLLGPSLDKYRYEKDCNSMKSIFCITNVMYGYINNNIEFIYYPPPAIEDGYVFNNKEQNNFSFDYYNMENKYGCCPVTSVPYCNKIDTVYNDNKKNRIYLDFIPSIQIKKYPLDVSIDRNFNEILLKYIFT